MQLPKQKSKRKPIIITISIILVILAGAGYFGWSEFKRINAANNVGEVVIKESGRSQSEQNDPACAENEDDKATTGIFCSEELGFKIGVPKIFTGKLLKSGNYPVYKSGLDPNTKTSAGLSKNVYIATANSGGSMLTFTIAQEPIRTGYIDVAHALQGTYFDATSKELVQVKTPMSTYDSATDKTSTTGTYTKSTPVPSFTGSGIQFFEGKNGDAGRTETIYVTVINDAIIKFSLKSVANPSLAASTTTNKILDELTSSLKMLRIL